MSAARDPREEARRAVAAAPGNAIAWIVLADAELDVGNVPAGEAAVQRALALAPVACAAALRISTD